MFHRIATTAAIACAFAALAGCSEKPQSAGTPRSDVAPYQGTGTAFQAPGWKAGDKTSWEQQLRTRGQGQNEYAKAQ